MQPRSHYLQFQDLLRLLRFAINAETQQIHSCRQVVRIIIAALPSQMLLAFVLISRKKMFVFNLYYLKEFTKSKA
jgi:hypothetical protein